jgi:2-polyprenyl-3-methyl-5-hydroxy-6-metoxy-1,4-benzoquinol methylase
VEFRKADLFDVEQTPSFDAVVSLDVIEHLTVEDGAQFLEAQAQLLKPGGMLIIGTPSIWSYPYQSSISQASHIQCYDLPDLVELAENYVTRTISFSMNDEVVHTGYHKMAWYYFVVGFGPKG